jgi:membrane-associated phospholipid phosphatase
MFPRYTLRIDHELQADLAALRGKEIELAAIERGVAVGTAIADHLKVRAEADGWDVVWTGTVPNGEAHWGGTTPQLPMWGEVRPWLWESGAELRVPPPPAFGSREFLEALAEVRAIAESRTPEQLEIARFWADGAGTYTPPGHWNEIAAQLIRGSVVGELPAARMLALMNVAMADAMIGCWDSKYTYWLLRPYQADPVISTPIGQPPHPSYPSGHACSSSAGAAVLAAFYPNEAEALERMAVEACDSRVYAGIHYRFDAEAGMGIGSRAAARALERGDALVQSEVASAFDGAAQSRNQITE